MQMTWMPTKTRSLLQASTDFFRMGGGLQITPFRDCMLYRAECFRADTQPIMDIVADLALNAEFEDWIVSDRHDESCGAEAINFKTRKNLCQNSCIKQLITETL